MRIMPAFALVVLALAAAPSGADVIDAAPTTFTVKTTFDIAAPPSAVYEAVVERVGSWWDSEHTWSGSAANLSLDGRAAGCFCERLPGGGSVQHMAVVWADPGKILRMTGGLGPLQEMPVTGVMTLTLTDLSGRTRLEMSYAVAGVVKGGLDSIAKMVDTVLAGQFGRLKRFVETGKP